LADDAARVAVNDVVHGFVLGFGCWPCGLMTYVWHGVDVV
jgi:hypothetical protein